MTVVDVAALACIAVGAGFFIAGSVGMLRFPDVFTRLHGTTKADNVGLGFLLLGAGIHAGSMAVASKLLLIWILVILASSTSSNIIARDKLSRSRNRSATGES